MIDSDDLREWLILLRTPGMNARRLREGLVSRGGATPLLGWLTRHGDALGAEGRAWVAAPDEAVLARDLAWLAGDDQRLLRCTDEDFPPQLEAIPDPPAALFVKGDASLLLRPQIAIVGARRAQAPGLANARRFAEALAVGGLLVTSGMADGVDGAAHEAALDAGEPTIAVIGTGPDRVYPRKHHALARRIAAHGALVSEYPPGVASHARHFPQRNRIIAGLSLGVLVIEAGLRSGSLITARVAGEQGREVFALPGSIHNALAEGCHALIAEGARLVQRADEILGVLAPAAVELGAELRARLERSDAGTAVGRRKTGPFDWRQDEEYRRLLDAMGYDPASLDALIGTTGFTAGALSSMLLMLELEGEVASLPGNRYQRVV
ncbi:DNA protecting protein DprA [Luteibacter rhizovicinus DSM 16549]|uniref:DNA protecting protein DprA n=3 Tax=Luteibacter rhizovicinus TaxID=242606 RepID=A0A1L3ER28_9GAMM|nr:DNA-processing protein DprA [Luteibacter rhizovicinus]APG03505.1 DNA protecting protein DprA [Luteibacter rhizovicinus DSM 16549]KLD79068.1 DNA processing protein DprA [Xanthomonas hyacinthi DSM 19077]